MPDQPLSDVHGYKVLARRLVWFAVFAFIAVAIAIGIVLWPNEGAH